MLCDKTAEVFKDMKLKKVVIIGVGLIGGSIGKALLKYALAEEVVGVCRRQVSLEKALTERSITSGCVNEYENSVHGADVIFIATPVNTIIETLDILSRALNDKNIIVTDAGSTKKEIVEHAARYKDRFTFIGAHPLAGSEKTGVEYSDADLFADSVCVLTPSPNVEKKLLGEMKLLWEKMGASVSVTSPDEHDKVLALTSHLPHAAAYALVGALKKEHFKYVSTGFGDTTRIASSDPILWSDIFISNASNVARALEDYRELLAVIERLILEKNKDKLREKLGEFKKLRDEYF